MAWCVEKIGLPKTENGYNLFHIHSFKQIHTETILTPLFGEHKTDICKKCGAERRSVFLYF